MILQVLPCTQVKLTAVFSCRAPLKLLCDNMKYQIISRAFYGCMEPFWTSFTSEPSHRL